MYVLIEGSRDGISVRLRDTERSGLPMLSQSTTSPTFGDSRLPSRFWAKMRVLENGCWEWKSCLSAFGYGQVRVGKTKDGSRAQRHAHRVVYEHLVGPIPPAFHAHHLCQFRACVNPSHIQPLVAREHILQGNSFSALYARRSHCKWGHVYDAANTAYRKGKGSRVCRACVRIRVRRTRQLTMQEA